MYIHVVFTLPCLSFKSTSQMGQQMYNNVSFRD